MILLKQQFIFRCTTCLAVVSCYDWLLRVGVVIVIIIASLKNPTIKSFGKDHQLSSMMVVEATNTAAAAAIVLPQHKPQQSRRAILITGATDGIGLTTAKNVALSNQYTDIMIHGRNSQRIEKAKDKLEEILLEKQFSKSSITNDDSSRSSSNNNVKIWSLSPADLSTIKGSRKVVSEVQSIICRSNDNIKLVCIMNNAGVFTHQYTRTDDGLELTFAVNVLSIFIITSLLLPTMLSKNSDNDEALSSSSSQQQRRIIIASSISQTRTIKDWDIVSSYHNKERQYNGHTAYGESKLLDAMLTMEFAHRLQQHHFTPNDIICHCLDPGTVNTKMLYAGWGPCGIHVNDALDETWLCTTDDTKHVNDVTGQYYISRTNYRASASAYDPKERNQLWRILSQLAPDAAAIWDFDWISHKEETKS